MSTQFKKFDEIQTKVINATSKVLPMHMQIQGLKLFIRAKKKTIGARRPIPQFVETSLPDVSTLKLEDIDVSNPFLYRQGQWRTYFKRLRDEAPVHYQKNSQFGPFWSVTRYEDILFVDKHHELFSAERPATNPVKAPTIQDQRKITKTTDPKTPHYKTNDRLMFARCRILR